METASWTKGQGRQAKEGVTCCDDAVHVTEPVGGLGSCLAGGSIPEQEAVERDSG